MIRMSPFWFKKIISAPTVPSRPFHPILKTLEISSKCENAEKHQQQQVIF